MKVFVGVAALCIALTACQAQEKPKTKLVTKLDSVGYAIGINIGKDFKAKEIGVDYQALVQGMKDAGVGDTTKMLLNDEGVRKTLMALQQDMQTKAMEKQKMAGAEARKKGAAFLAENAKKDGVKTTASGLQYKVIQEGKGESPTKESTVKVHYEGKLIDGKVFDSSIKRGEPIEFPASGVIPGWTEALLMMKPGAKYQLFIPADLAYGDQGAGGEIGPGETLIFDVELIEVKAAGKTPAGK